jgi:tetratricopeptide (TPR) repeat protein
MEAENRGAALKIPIPVLFGSVAPGLRVPLCCSYRPVRAIRSNTTNSRQKPTAFPDAPKKQPYCFRDVLICLALLMATFAVYAQVRRFEFVNLDDSAYTSGNLHVRRGITLEGIEWALTSQDAANWFPATWISHMLDCQFFGLDSGWHHITNVLIHGLASLLLFAFLYRATGARWRSALVAFLWAVHPLHVESVAWVAERKDVLSGFFWFLTLWAYVWYTERLSSGRYLLVLLMFCLGLMAKPMIVTLPFVLLLLDFWPLRRLSFPVQAQGGGKWRPGVIILEKAPLMALSLAVSVITYLAQHRGGAVKALSAFPIGLRFENALISCVVYIVQMFWPARLAVIYPYPRHIPAWQAVLAGLALAGASMIVVRLRRRCPYLAMGWLWYLGTLVPVIGLVQVGLQARADRYTYIPMVGLSIMVAWAVAEAARHPRVKLVAALVMSLVCLTCAALAWLQVQHWRNSETLFRHALEVTAENAAAQVNLANYLVNVPGKLPEAVGLWEAALRIDPDSVTAHTGLGNALARIPGRLPESFPQFQAALRLAPDWPIPHNELGNALLKAGRLPEAIAQFNAALRLDPDYADAHYNLGVALSEIPGRSAEAMSEYQAALRIKPDYAEAQLNVGNVLAGLPGRLAEAIQAFEAALRIRPDYAEAHYNLGQVLSRIPGRLPDAIAEYEAALRIRRDYAEAHNNLANILSRMPGRMPDAIAEYEAALRVRPDYADGHYNLGVALSRLPHRLPEALFHLETALRLKPDPELRRAVERLRAASGRQPN